jgi:hypothetical protein
MTHTPPIHHHLSPLGEKRREKKRRKVQSWPDPDGLYSYHPDNERDDPSDHGVNERRTT